MSILDTLVYQGEQCIVRFTSGHHLLDSYIDSAIKNESPKDQIMFHLPNNHFIALKKNPPFKILCVFSSESTNERIFHLLEDVEEKILLILEKQKEMSVEAKEGLHDYIEKLVNYYSDRTRRMTNLENLRDAMKQSYAVVQLNTHQLERQGSQESDKRNKFRGSARSPTWARREKRASELNSSTQSMNFQSKSKPRTLKIFFVIVLNLIILGLIFALYYCGGYSFEYCKE
jgi:hypothetical protein